MHDELTDEAVARMFPLDDPDLGITPRQRQVFCEIVRRIAAGDGSPTVRQLQRLYDIKSPNGIVCHLKALERKRLIVVVQHKACGIRVPGLKITVSGPGAYVGPRFDRLIGDFDARANQGFGKDFTEPRDTDVRVSPATAAEAGLNGQ